MKAALTDLINACFECFAAVVLWGNVVKLYRDKQVRGVHWGPTAVFAFWGVWNLYYYPSLGQIWSGWAAGSVALSNTVWVALAIRYRNR